MASATETQLFHSLIRSIKLFFGVMAGGTIGFWIIGITFPLMEGAAPDYDPSSFLNALYMSAITITTVGYGETANFHLLEEPGATVGEVYTIIYVIVSYVAVVYASANIVAALVEGAVGKEFQRRRMEKALQQLSDHFIVCGAGSTGRYVIDELLKTKNKVVIIDRVESNLHDWTSRDDCFPLVGDGTDDELLAKAGIKRARGVFAVLHDDKDNLFIVLTARQANETCRIVGRATDVHNRGKMQVVGANAVISPNQIGGLRMASEMLRPSVVSFLDTMLRNTSTNMRFEEVPVGEGDYAANRSLKDIDAEGATGLVVVGIYRADKSLDYNPPESLMVHPGDALIVIADADGVKKLRAHAQHGPKGWKPAAITKSSDEGAQHATQAEAASQPITHHHREAIVRVSADDVHVDPRTQKRMRRYERTPKK